MAFWNRNDEDKGVFYRYREGTHAWRKVAGGITTTKGRIISIVGTVAVMGVPWWIPSSWVPSLAGNIEISIPTSILIAGIAAILGGILLLGSSYLRNRSIRSLKMKRELHKFAHTLRDEYMKAQKNPISIHGTSDILCGQILEYFKILTQRDDLSVAIRIARKQRTEKTAYETMGRAGLNHMRKDSSEALHEDEGVANLMRHMDSNFVLYYPDILEAEKKGKDVYHLTENDKMYPNDVKSLMVAPINGWDGESDSMLGMLFVGCQEPSALGELYTDSLMFIGDALANLYSEFANQVSKLQVDL